MSARTKILIGLLVLAIVGVGLSSTSGLFGSFMDFSRISVRSAPISSRSILPTSTRALSATSSIAVTKEGPMIYTYSPTLAASTSVEKPTLLTQFSICSGPEYVNITGVKIHMYANANFNFIPYLDSEPLWKKEIKDMANWKPQVNFSAYQDKIYELVFDSPKGLSSNFCRKLNIMATNIQPGAGWIMPEIISVGTTVPVTFYGKTTTGNSFSKPLVDNDSFGLGALSLFTTTPGPLLISNATASIQSYTGTTNASFTFSGTHAVSQKQHISSLTFRLKTNATAALSAKLRTSIIDFAPHFWKDGYYTPLVYDAGLPVILEPNVSVTVPVNITLEPLTKIALSIDATFPAESASYILELESMQSDGGVFLNKDLNAMPVFAGKDSGLIVIDIPGQIQPPFTQAGDGKDCNGECPGADAATQMYGSARSLTIGNIGGSATANLEEMQQDFLSPTPKWHGMGFFHFKNMEADSSIMEYNAEPMSVTFKSNLTQSIDVMVWMSNLKGNGTMKKVYSVQPNVPILLDVPKFSNSLSISLALASMPVTTSSFYIEPILNAFAPTYGKDFSMLSNGTVVNVKAGMKTPVVDYITNQVNVSPLTFPKTIYTLQVNGVGLYEISNMNTPLPYKQLVDLDTLNPNDFITMNQFCLKANQKTYIKKFTFGHTARETSPFDAIQLNLGGNSLALLQKTGWLKTEANFPMSSDIILNPGQTNCFALQANGILDSALSDMYFDLTTLSAQLTDGTSIPLTLINGKPLSAVNPLLGTHMDFL